ncbi:MAG: zf-HC2 domain-containing protein [Desulfopila sp.]
MNKYWLFNCKDISRLVSDSMDRNLSLRHRLGIRFHLMMCRYCHRFARQLKRMRQVIRKETAPQTPPRQTLSDEQKQQIREQLKSHLGNDQ